MSIASRLTAMEEHISDDYDVLELAGADLTNVDKNILNLKPTWKERLLYFLNNGTQEIWDNWDKRTSSGTEMSINGTEEAPMSLTYKGNTYQYQANGTNLFNPAWAVDNCTVSGDEITLTKSGDQYFICGGYNSTSEIFSMPAGDYYVICSTENSNVGFNIYGYYEGETLKRYFGSRDVVAQPFTFSSKFIVLGIQAEYNQGASSRELQGHTIKIYVGPNSTYSPYGNTPSPTNPSPVQVVSGDNSINVVGKSLANIPEELSFTRSISYSVNLPAGTYHVTYTSASRSTNEGHLTIRFNDNAKSEYLDSNDTTVTITNPETQIYLFAKDNYSSSSGISATIEKLMLSSTGGTYTPYQSASYPISLGVENLLNTTQNKTTFSNVTLTPVYNDDSTLKYIVLNGTASGNNQVVLGTVAFKSGETYTISGVTGHTDSTLQIFTSSSTAFPSGNRLQCYNGAVTKTALGDETCDIRLYIYSGVTYNNVKIYPMIIKGNKASSYTPYGKTPIELCKIGTYQDKIDKSTGKNLLDRSTCEENKALTWNTGVTFNETNSISTDYIKVNIGDTIQCTYNCQKMFYDKDKNYLGALQFSGDVEKNSNGNVSNYFTVPNVSEIYYVRFGYRATNNSGVNLLTSNIMVNKGTALPYEPYGKVWYKYSAIGKYIFTGNETWSSGAYGVNTWFSNNIINTKYDTTKIQIMSNIFKGVSQDDRATSGDNVIYTYSNVGFNIRNTTLTTLAEVQTATNGNYIYYVLATPTYETITDTTLIGQLEAIKKSVEGQTNISQVNDGLPFELDVSALSDGTVSLLNSFQTLNTQQLQPMVEPLETQEEPLEEIQEEPNEEPTGEIEEEEA